MIGGDNPFHSFQDEIHDERLALEVFMGFLDGLFDKEKKEQKRYLKLQKTLTNMYVQPAERSAIILQLVEMETPEAVGVLLARYKESAPNSTVDLEEKELIYERLVMLGRQPNDLDIVKLVTDHLKRVDGQINWPLKVLTDLLEFEEFASVVADLLETCDTEYQQNPEKKQELILRSQELKTPRIAEQVSRFLEDMDETVRFLAVDAILAQDDDELACSGLTPRLLEEESLRISQKICAAFNDHHEWRIPEDLRADIAEVLPEEYGVHNAGHIYKRR